MENRNFRLFRPTPHDRVHRPETIFRSFSLNPRSIRCPPLHDLAYHAGLTTHSSTAVLLITLRITFVRITSDE